MCGKYFRFIAIIEGKRFLVNINKSETGFLERDCHFYVNNPENMFDMYVYLLMWACIIYILPYNQKKSLNKK